VTERERGHTTDEADGTVSIAFWNLCGVGPRYFQLAPRLRSVNPNACQSGRHRRNDSSARAICEVKAKQILSHGL